MYETFFLSVDIVVCRREESQNPLGKRRRTGNYQAISIETKAYYYMCFGKVK